MKSILLTVAILALSSFLLIGCATEAKYQATLNSWVGSSEDSLVEQWGPPTSVYETKKKRYLTYFSSGQMYLPGTPPSYNTSFVGNTAYTRQVGGSSPTMVNLSCKTVFTLEKGYITLWNYNGNNCISK